MKVVGSSENVARFQVRYAMKCVPKRTLKENNQEMGFQTERRILMEIDHPFLLRIVKTFKDPAYLFLVTEVITGGNLYSAIRCLGILDQWEAQFYIGSALVAACYLAEKNIAFRDMRPENFLIDHQGFCKLINFGSAKKVPDGQKAYTLIGSPYYAAPEAILGSGHNSDVDLWSIGIIAYECVCGPYPFGNDAESKIAIMREVVKGKLEFVICEDPLAIAMITGLLRRKPDRRLGSRFRGDSEIWDQPFFHAGEFTKETLVGRRLEPPLQPLREVWSGEHTTDVERPAAPNLYFEWENEF